LRERPRAVQRADGQRVLVHGMTTRFGRRAHTDKAQRAARRPADTTPVGTGPLQNDGRRFQMVPTIHKSELPRFRTKEAGVRWFQQYTHRDWPASERQACFRWFQQYTYRNWPTPEQAGFGRFQQYTNRTCTAPEQAGIGRFQQHTNRNWPAPE
jgi:hypothetical protein